MREFDLVVVGAGMAGLTAGLFGARYGLTSLVVERSFVGGQIVTAARIENYPGFPQGISGAELGALVQEQASNDGCQMEVAEVLHVVQEDPFFILKTSSESFRAKAVVLAVGSAPRRLGVPGESTYFGRGVSHCATCDGPLFVDKVVGVVGGGDSAADEALTLAEFASKVILFHRRDTLRAQKVMCDRLLSSPKIQTEWNTEVTKVSGGTAGLTAVEVRDVMGSETREVPLAGLFVYVGPEPNSTFLRGVVEMDAAGHIAVDIWMRTNVPGLYAVGDVRQHSAAQVVACAGDGATAVLDAIRYIAGRKWS